MLLDQYDSKVDGLLKKVRDTQRENVEKAGKMIAQAVREGACVHVHDTGHIIDSELIYRGGGLAIYKKFKYALTVENPVRQRDRSALDTSMAGLAAYALKASGAMPGDIMILGSVSGRNLPVVDLAIEAKKMGLKLIVITSMTYSSQVTSDHPSGKRLFELADIVIDNCAPAGEGMMQVEGLPSPMCAASGLTAAYMMWSISVVFVEDMMAHGIVPGVYQSHNYPGGAEFNVKINQTYEEKGW